MNSKIINNFFGFDTLIFYVLILGILMFLDWGCLGFKAWVVVICMLRFRGLSYCGPWVTRDTDILGLGIDVLG